jgi:hypothetical protein
MTIDFDDGENVLDSEFAQVAVKLDTTGNAPRLRLEDLRSGRVRYLDALELEAIIWLPDERLTSLLDPSHSRWRGEARGSAGGPDAHVDG